MTQITLTGRVLKVLYADEAKPYVVFEMAADDAPVTVVAQAAGVTPGQEMRVTGDFREHPRFGRRFRAATLLALAPERLEGLLAWLGSGRVPGVGPKLATRIVEFFGAETRAVLEEGGTRLGECPGIGRSKATAIAAAWNNEKAARETFVLLCDLGLTPSQAGRASRAYGEGAPARVKADPYDLARVVPGIGFRTADAIAGRMGIEPGSLLRLRAAARYVLETASDAGHLYLPADVLVAEAARVTDRPEEGILEAVAILVAGGEAIQEDAPDGPVVYLAPLWRAEVQAARRIRLLAAQNVPALLVEDARVGDVVLAPSQLRALRTVAGAPVAVLTGGPGTGKTTIVSALLRAGERAGRKVVLAAPTGRAAMRMRETTGHDARTLHRLLEFNPRAGRFLRNESLPIDADWVVIDESSMLDAVLMDCLLRAIAPGTRLTFVGDADQLPPVGPGDPFRALAESGTVPVARLGDVFRQGAGSAIVVAAHRILAGEEPESAAPNRDEPGDFHVTIREEPEDIARMVETLVAERIPARFGLDPRTDVQVLAPMRKGDCGTDALNRRLRARLNPAAADRPGLAPGDRVIQNRNNYDRDVFNGDIGSVLAVGADGAVTVRFEEREVTFDMDEADDLSLAHAITIHKSQGSEFPAVVVVLSTQHWVMLRRNLLYTAVTRGRRLVVVCGSRRAIRVALDNARLEPRNTRMADRLRGLGASDPDPGPF
jgi:exodeoxyribonuclease V alpha subunit